MLFADRSNMAFPWFILIVLACTYSYCWLIIAFIVCYSTSKILAELNTIVVCQSIINYYDFGPGGGGFRGFWGLGLSV